MTMNQWLANLLVLSAVSVGMAHAFAPPMMAQRGDSSAWGTLATHRPRKTALTLPYQNLDQEVALGSDIDAASLFEMPTSSTLFSDLPVKVAYQPHLGTDSVNLSLLPSEKNDEMGAQYPLVITPKNDSSLRFLTAFLSRNRNWIDEQILHYGAVLFRGFDVDSAGKVQSAVQAFEPNLNNQYRGTSPRSAQDGTKYVFSAAEVPAHFPIAQHLEMSFLPAPPRRLFFSALKAPDAVGGETALGDFRAVYRDLPKKLRDKLAYKKLRYTRTHRKKGANPRLTHDVASLQSWSDVFDTTDKSVVEQKAREEGLPMRWEGKNNDTFISEFVSEPFQYHPVTQEPVWFNHAQVFHWSTFPAELFLAFRRTKEWRFLARAVVSGLASVVKYGLLRRKMALDVSFGDGSRISLFEMHQIRKAIHNNMVFNRWQKGDIVMIDNFSTSHGRQPTYDSGRRVVVSWSDPLEKSNEPVSEE